MYVEKELNEGNRAYTEAEFELAKFEAKTHHGYRKKGIEVSFIGTNDDLHFGACLNIFDIEEIIDALIKARDDFRKEYPNAST